MPAMLHRAENFVSYKDTGVVACGFVPAKCTKFFRAHIVS